MMTRTEKKFCRVVTGLVAFCFSWGVTAMPANGAPDIPAGFDSHGEKLFNRYNNTPLAAMTGTDGRRNLNSFYELRQYPGSPPRVPHAVPIFYREDNEDCIGCHELGGYDSDLDAYAPVTPHPESENCYQCHVPQRVETLFRETNWQSIKPPKLGLSQMAGSPPPIPHSIQQRDDCIACHSGPAAVAGIRVEHASRGNCRQCHVPMISTDTPITFQRDK